MTEYVPTISNAAFASDDTAILRSIAEVFGINLSPAYSCTYHPRNSIRQYVKHVFNRGIFFVDGHLNKVSGLFRKIIKIVTATTLFIVVSLVSPVFFLVSTSGLLIIALFTDLITDIPIKKRFLFLMMILPFCLIYFSGVTAGMYHRMNEMS